MVVSLVVVEVIWSHVGKRLRVSTSIVGSTTFTGFDINRYLDAYYLLALVMPALAIATYMLVARVGPLRAVPSKAPWPPELADNRAPSGRRDPVIPGVVLRLTLPAFVVGLAMSEGHSVGHKVVSWTGLVSGSAYCVAVLVVSFAWGRMRWPLRTGGRHTDAGRQDWLSVLPRVNAAAAIGVIPVLYYVSRHTVVLVSSTNAVVHYPWFPIWAAAVLAAVVLAVVVLLLLRAPGSEGQRGVERGVMTFLVGPAAIFLLTSRLTGALGAFSGFDDSHYLVGAHLTFAHGFFPFRNLYLLHGVLYDDLYGAVGLAVFGNSRWGGATGSSMLFVPLGYVFLYLLGVRISRGNRYFIVLLSLAMIGGLIPSIDPRFIFLPLVLIAFERVVVKGGWGWSGVFMFALIANCIITPEIGLPAIGMLLTVVGFDLVHGVRGAGIVRRFKGTLTCGVWGVALTVLWVVYLALNGAVRTFIEFYITAASGHQYAGSFPMQWNLRTNKAEDVYFFLPVVLFLLTVWRVSTKLRMRSTWTPDDWLMTASAMFVPLYFPEALDRLDSGHVLEVFIVSLPLIVLWGRQLVNWADRWIRERAVIGIRDRNRVGQVRSSFRPVRINFSATMVGVIATGLFAPITIGSALRAPGHFYAQVPEPAPSAVPTLGYTEPGTVNLAQIQDLSKVLDVYAGKSAPIYDLAGEGGVLYYLLNRIPASRFYVIQVVESRYTQGLVISALRRREPPVIIFNDNTFGLPSYDGITSMEREYDVSQWILDHYKPLLDTDGQLLLIRNDLAATAPPPPALSQPPLTTGLYFDMTSCAWGDIPNYFSVPTDVSASASTLLNVTSLGAQDQSTVSGWAFDKTSGTPPSSIVAASGSQVSAAVAPALQRSDVAAYLNAPAASGSGFSFSFATPAGHAFTLYALTGNGSLVPFFRSKGSADSTPPTLKTPDGVVHAVVESGGDVIGSNVDSLTAKKVYRWSVAVPAHQALSDYQWLSVGDTRGLGKMNVQIADVPTMDPSHSIQFSSLGQGQKRLFLQVGSCLQWHGYQSPTLYMTTDGPSAGNPFKVALVQRPS